MSIYVTSDLHFNHDREFIYGPRGFKNITEMNETLIKNWNEVISSEDDIYVLGDFFLGTDKNYIHEVLSKLNGKIHLVFGNHDTAAKIREYTNNSLVIVEGYAAQITYKKRQFYMSHYPTLTASLESNPSQVVFNLFGHTHSKDKFYEDRPYMYNVAIDANDNKPVSIEEINKRIDEKINECISYLK